MLAGIGRRAHRQDCANGRASKGGPVSNEVKLLLSGFRPEGQDASDPIFANALREVAQDPQLRTWFAEAQAFDRAVADRLGEVAPPEELRAAILAGEKASRSNRRWLQPWTWAAAAVLALLGVIAALWPA